MIVAGVLYVIPAARRICVTKYSMDTKMPQRHHRCLISMEVAVGLPEHATFEMSRPIGPWTRLDTTRTARDGRIRV